MKKLYVFILALALMSLGFVNNNAQRMKDNNRSNIKILKELNLSDTQKEKIKDIRFTHEELQIELTADLRKNRLQTKKLISSKEIEKSTLFDLVEKSTNLELELKKNKISVWLNIREVLSEDQRKIWANQFFTLNNDFLGKFRNEKFRHKMRNNRVRN